MEVPGIRSVTQLSWPSSPDLTVPLQDKPEFTDGCVNRRAVRLMRRHRTVNHVAALAVHDEPNVCPRRRPGIGFSGNNVVHFAPPPPKFECSAEQ